MANEESGTVSQLRRVLSDQEVGLRELRRKRREYRERQAEMDVKEIEYLLGIETTKDAIKNFEKGEMR